MIYIKHKISDQILQIVNSNSLQKAQLANKDLRGAKLVDMDLSGANLSGTDLTGALLTRTRLTDVNLSNALLKDTDLGGTRFLRTGLIKTDFDGANFFETIFIDCKSLHKANNLDKINHNGPSTLDVRTLRKNVLELDDEFLTGVGYSFMEIKNFRKVYTSGFEYYSCFISYAHQDYKFASQLHNDLENRNVSSWLDVISLGAGDVWRYQINENIKKRDKIIIICSKISLSRPEVIEEIIEAIEHERETDKTKLFPIRLDDFIFTPEAEQLAKSFPERQRREDWLSYIRAFHMPKFGKQYSSDSYKLPFEKLLDRLKKS